MDTRPGGPAASAARPPLRAGELAAAVVRPGSLWRGVDVVERVPSTNAELATAADKGEGRVLVAEFQTTGRGRLDRGWQAPPRSALTFSVRLAPTDVPLDRLPWLPLLAGVAVVDALADETAEAVPEGLGLKWPNDVLVGDAKLAGILAERAGDAVVLGIGLNVTVDTGELPTDTATSLLLAGGPDVDRTTLLIGILRRLEYEYLRWRGALGDADDCGLAGRYRRACLTLGRSVRVDLPCGDVLEGTAVDLSRAGALVVRTSGGATRELAAGDVVHVRAASARS